MSGMLCEVPTSESQSVVFRSVERDLWWEIFHDFSKLVSRDWCNFDMKCLIKMCGYSKRHTVTLAKTVRCIAAECHWKQGVYEESGPEEVQQMLTLRVLLILIQIYLKLMWLIKIIQNLFDHLVFHLLPKLLRYCDALAEFSEVCLVHSCDLSRSWHVTDSIDSHIRSYQVMIFSCVISYSTLCVWMDGRFVHGIRSTKWVKEPLASPSTLQGLDINLIYLYQICKEVNSGTNTREAHLFQF